MSRRQRKSAAAITLFSFQDIIMSTSGIMILIVLLLSLELIQRKGAAGPSVPTTTTDASELQTAIETTKATNAALESQLQSGDQSLQVASTLTPTQLKQRVEELRARVQDETTSHETLQFELRQAAQADPEMHRQAQRLLELQAQLNQLQRQRNDLQQAVNSVKEDDRPVFTLPRGMRRQGWLVDVAASRILAAPLERAQAPLSFEAKKNGLLGNASAEGFFLEWVRKEASGDYFFLLVRPGGSPIFEQIVEEFDRRGTAYGFDVIGSERVLLDPLRGAAQ